MQHTCTRMPPAPTVSKGMPYSIPFLLPCRILRVLRVFRMKNIMQRHIEGAVVEAAGKLVFSLISIIFIAAGLFFELEKYGVSLCTALAILFQGCRVAGLQGLISRALPGFRWVSLRTVRQTAGVC